MASTTTTHAPPPKEDLEPVAAVLAFLLPGAGHFYLGETKRGALIAIGVLGMFFGGIFIAGIDAVDRRENFVWFVGQALVGPTAFAVDWVHHTRFKVVDDRYPSGKRAAAPNEIRDPRTGQPIFVRDAEGNPITFTDPATGQNRMSTMADRPPYVQSVGRPAELGTLFSTIAGMMNLICIIDAGMRRRPAAGGASHA
jgi:hypothetical protein